ncbi:MAG: hypothetical protein WAX69_02385 [Victivallales bacterium]
MSRIFETTGKDIERLDAFQLTKLLLRLMTLEAEKFGIPRSCVSGSLNITARDGGEDANIKWDGAPDKTEWFPNRYTLFQCKATDTSPSTCSAEVFDSEGKDIKKRVDEVLSAGGAYVLFCTTSCNTAMDLARVEAIRNSFRKLGKSYSETVSIQVYSADKISSWVNQYVSAVVTVKNDIGASLPSSVSTWKEWSGYSENSISFVSDADLQKYISTLRSHFLENRRVARIIGLSGVGKTRLAFETFRVPLDRINDPVQAALSDSCVYVNAEKETNISSTVAEWVKQRMHGTVVVDNCDFSLHKLLCQEVRHTESFLNLLTLDYSVDDHPSDHPYILLPRVSDEIIRGMLKQVYPGFSDADRDRIVEFSQGFPRMAVLIAQAHLDKERDIGKLNDKDLVEKLLWQRGTPDSTAKKVIMVCSLFEHLGFVGDVAEQRIFAAEQICLMDKDEFFRHAESFIQKHILDRRNRYVRVVPRPLAITLAAEWWSGCSPELAKNLFLSEMPQGMAQALCDQAANLQFVQRAREIVSMLYGKKGPFYQAEVLLSEQGSRLFRSLVEVNPEPCVNALDHVIGGFSRDHLLAIVGPTRRNLVSSIEKLCFWKETFPKAARLMFALAAAENEVWGNNATHQFLQLYHIYLSGTQADPPDKISILDEALSSTWSEKRVLAIQALGSMLETDSFNRMGGVEKQGSRPTAEDWYPKTNKDIFDYLEEALKRLTQISCSSSELASLAKKELGDRIRGLIAYDRIDSLEKAIIEIGKTSKGFWPEAIHSIRDALEYDGEEMGPILRERVDLWQKILTPATLPDRLRLIVSIPDYEHHKDKDDNYEDISAKRAQELAVELIKREQELLDNLSLIMTGEQRQGHIFGYELAQHLVNPKKFIFKALDILRVIPEGKGNPSVICGFLGGLKNRELRTEVLEQVSQDKDLSIYLVEMTRLSQAEKADLDRIIRAAQECKITVSQIHAFSYNSVLDHLHISEVIYFCDQIASFDVASVACAFDMLYMYCYRNKSRWEAALVNFRRYLMTKGLLSEIGRNPIYRDHYWQETVCSLLRKTPKDDELSVAITKEIISSCGEEKFSYDAKFYVSKVLSILLSDYFDHVWPIIGAGLLSEKWRVVHNLGYLLGKMGEKTKGDLVLAKAHLPSLMEWCLANKPNGPKRLARIIPVYYLHPDSTYKWHEFARTMIDSFGDDVEVLSAISGNLHTFSWSGSVVPYYERQIHMMEELSTSPHHSVKEWAKKNIEWLKEQIVAERNQEEEEKIGIYK